MSENKTTGPVVPDASALHTYLCFAPGLSNIEIKSDSLYHAKQEFIKQYQVHRKHHGLVSVYLAKHADGREGDGTMVHSTSEIG